MRRAVVHGLIGHSGPTDEARIVIMISELFCLPANRSGTMVLRPHLGPQRNLQDG